ncbi:hypothetical protein MNBD_PLANCTO02-1875 [hydrothermal vent metagenome]|uniref:Ice-binding protein C-terminal domain-containing protein n=1 Tax=hydrothermal vent metagenome TaxID=652676 RepID=A0A3B1DL35_9ZZZZ
MKRVITLLAVAALIATTITETQADFVSGFTGNTQFSDGSTSGFVNFAVYQNDGLSHLGGTGNWVTDLGLGAVVSNLPGVGFPPAVTGLERNVFFYQVTATSLSAQVNGVTIPVLDPWVSAGFLSGEVFADADGSVGLGNNLGTDSTGPNAPSVDGVSTGFATDALAVNPATGSPSNQTFGFDGLGLTNGQTSSVFFLTSNSQPVTPLFANANLSGGGTPLLPASNPEPGSLILLSMGMAGVVYRRRKKKTELLEEEATEVDA